jgi:hypothetical protein
MYFFAALLVTANVVSSLLILVTLVMEALHSSETSILKRPYTYELISLNQYEYTYAIHEDLPQSLVLVDKGSVFIPAKRHIGGSLSYAGEDELVALFHY